MFVEKTQETKLPQHGSGHGRVHVTRPGVPPRPPAVNSGDAGASLIETMSAKLAVPGLWSLPLAPLNAAQLPTEPLVDRLEARLHLCQSNYATQPRVTRLNFRSHGRATELFSRLIRRRRRFTRKRSTTRAHLRPQSRLVCLLLGPELCVRLPSHHASLRTSCRSARGSCHQGPQRTRTLSYFPICFRYRLPAPATALCAMPGAHKETG